MLHRRRLMALGAWGVAAPRLAAAFVDPIEMPAPAVARPALGSLLATACAGGRVVAAGQRGRIVYSDDGGKAWTQAAVPVSVDLVGLVFSSATAGWAVGHGGVVLVTRDAGSSWNKSLAGRQADEVALRYYATLAAPTPGDARLRDRLRAQFADRRAQPFLDVTFDGLRDGFVVGAFNTAFRTDDGGATWVPWMDRTANPQELHLNAVR